MAERRLCPELHREVVAEILLRLPPRDPTSLIRASAVSKTRVAAVSDPDFRTRLRDRHGAPPVLGFLHNWEEDEGVPRFIHTTASSPFLLAAPDCRSWRALDCRHGRALFLSKGTTKELLLWEPATGAQHRVRVPAAFEAAEQMPPTATVLCAADGCGHRDCHGGPFCLVFVFSVKVRGAAHVTSALVYSSETGTWGEPTSTQGQGVFSMKFTLRYTSVLVEKRSLLYFMSDNVLILEYDLARHNLALLHTQEQYGYTERFNILLAEGGELGFCQYSYPKLKVWTWEATTDAQWVPSRGIFLDSLLPIGSLLDVDSTVQVMGFAEEANVIFFNTASGIFMVNQQSQQVSKVFDKHGYGFCNVIPVVSFYTPMPRGQHRDPLLLGPSEEPCDEEDKTVDQAHRLFNKGSNAIKEGGLVNAFGCVRDP